MNGTFVVFEGGEKVGKTTQLCHTRQYLKKRGYRIVLTHEPGGGDPNIRKILLDKKRIISPEEELDYFCIDRALHIDNVIKPALEKGKIVLCDRFEPSTIAYQGYGRGMDINLIKEKSARARRGVWPHLIVLLDADPELVLSREEATSRFDAEKIDFHKCVREGFLQQVKEDPARWRIVDATKHIAVVWKDIQKHLDVALQEWENKIS